MNGELTDNEIRVHITHCHFCKRKSNKINCEEVENDVLMLILMCRMERMWQPQMLHVRHKDTERYEKNIETNEDQIEWNFIWNENFVSRRRTRFDSITILSCFICHHFAFEAIEWRISHLISERGKEKNVGPILSLVWFGCVGHVFISLE